MHALSSLLWKVRVETYFQSARKGPTRVMRFTSEMMDLPMVKIGVVAGILDGLVQLSRVKVSFVRYHKCTAAFRCLSICSVFAYPLRVTCMTYEGLVSNGLYSSPQESLAYQETISMQMFGHTSRKRRG